MTIPFDQSLVEFEAELSFQGKSDKTMKNYLCDVRKFLEFAGKLIEHDTSGAADPADLSGVAFDHLKKYFIYLNQKGLHPKTRKRYRAAIVMFYRMAAEKYTIPDLGAVLPAISVRESDPVIITPEDLQSILHLLNEKDPVQAKTMAMVALIAATGIRREEAASLLMGDVYLSGNKLNWLLQVPSVKPAHRRRIVPFGDIERPGDIATCHFGYWFMRRQHRLGGAKSAAHCPLFSRAINDDLPLTPEAIGKAVKRAFILRANANPQLPYLEQCSTHTLRHFYATMSCVNKMNIVLISRNMGHAKVDQTMRYIHYASIMDGMENRKHGPTITMRAKPSLNPGQSQEFATAIRLSVPSIGGGP